MDPYVCFTRKEAIEAIEYAMRIRCNTEELSDEELRNLAKEDYPDTDEDGNLYSTYNPKSKWDWYSVGGRFCDILVDRCEEDSWVIYDCAARVKDIDFSPDMDEYENALAGWDNIMNGQSFFNPNYFKEYYGDKETYARRAALFTTMAVVTPDGEWHEKGEIGWFGCSGETPEEAADWDENYHARFIDSADPDWILTIVDCHI